MDVPRGSCGVEVMTPGVVASKRTLYQEADRGPATPRTRFGEAPLHLRRCFWTMGCVGYDHRMEVALNGREVDPRAKRVTVDKVEEVTHGKVCRVCATISPTKEGRLRHWI